MRDTNSTTSYFNSKLAVALAVLLVLAVANISSSGVIKGGDDEGSGLGGTGRLPAPTGESGFGGTGFKPFLGVNENNELQILGEADSRESAITAVVEKNYVASAAAAPTLHDPFVVVSNEMLATFDSSAINISESIQHSLNANTVAFQELHAQLAVSSFVTVDTSLNSELVSSRATEEMATDSASIQAPDTKPNLTEQVDKQPQSQLTWSAVFEYLSANVEAEPAASNKLAKLSTDGHSAQETARFSRPEILQRPQLPPVQRIRPIRRASILPPRIKPLRL